MLIQINVFYYYLFINVVIFIDIKSNSVVGFIEQKFSCYNMKKSLLYKEIVKEMLIIKCKKLFSKINLDMFDKKNPPMFVCRKCEEHFVYPLDLVKHVITCKK